jgi:hypothetical protein
MRLEIEVSRSTDDDKRAGGVAAFAEHARRLGILTASRVPDGGPQMIALLPRVRPALKPALPILRPDLPEFLENLVSMDQ